MTHAQITDSCITFIREIGIRLEECTVTGATFVPGIQIKKGALHVDRSLLMYPGDLLHEAGHIAVTPSEERPGLDGDATNGMKQKEGDEMAVLLWSFLAAREIGIPAKAVFHDGGYKGDSDWLLNEFTSKNYIGFYLLQWMGMVIKNDVDDVAITTWMRA